MSEPKIHNKYHNTAPSDAVYVGRGSKWGNPFRIGMHGSREEVVEKYCYWIVEQEHLMRDIHELRGKDLICFCAPKLCHAEILRESAND